MNQRNILVFFAALLMCVGLGVFVECDEWWQDSIGLFLFLWGLNIHVVWFPRRADL